jgi:hypothetical protein
VSNILLTKIGEGISPPCIATYFCSTDNGVTFYREEEQVTGNNPVILKMNLHSLEDIFRPEDMFEESLWILDNLVS